MAMLLLIEDDPSQWVLYRQALEKAGHQVIAVETVSEAFSVLQQKGVDVMVLNLAASRMEGDLNVLKKSLVQFPRVRVIIHAGDDLPVAGRASEYARGHKVISSDLRYLKRRVEQALRQKESP